MATLTDRRPALWQVRRRAVDRVTLLRQQRRAICGCTRCCDDTRGEELDYLIRLGVEQIHEIEDQITDGSSRC